MTGRQYAGALLVLAVAGLLGGGVAERLGGSPATAAETPPRLVKPRGSDRPQLQLEPAPTFGKVMPGPQTIVQGWVNQLDVYTLGDGPMVRVCVTKFRDPIIQPNAVFVTDPFLVSLAETAFTTGDPVYFQASRWLSGDGDEIYLATEAWMQDFEPLQRTP